MYSAPLLWLKENNVLCERRGATPGITEEELPIHRYSCAGDRPRPLVTWESVSDAEDAVDPIPEPEESCTVVFRRGDCRG